MCPWSQSENQVGRDEIRIKLAMMSIHLHFFQLTLKVFLISDTTSHQKGKDLFQNAPWCEDAVTIELGIPIQWITHDNNKPKDRG